MHIWLQLFKFITTAEQEGFHRNTADGRITRVHAAHISSCSGDILYHKKQLCNYCLPFTYRVELLSYLLINELITLL